MFEKFLSRRFIVTVLSSVFFSGSAALGLNIPVETILAVSGVIASYILGTSYVDAKSSSGAALEEFLTLTPQIDEHGNVVK